MHHQEASSTLEVPGLQAPARAVHGHTPTSQRGYADYGYMRRPGPPTSSAGRQSTATGPARPASLQSNPQARPPGLRSFGSGVGGRNPLNPDDPSGDDGGVKLPVDAEPLPWLLQLQRYHVLPVSEAEHVLITALQNIGTVMNDLFQAETESGSRPARHAAFGVMQEAVTQLIAILDALPDTSFQDQHGSPDPQFHNVVRGLCHLWRSMDNTQLTSVTRLMSLSRPADAVAQHAVSGIVSLPGKQRVVRSVLAASPDRVVTLAIGNGFVSLLAIMAGFAGALGSLSDYIAVAALGVLLLCTAAWGILFYATMTNRQADASFFSALSRCTFAKLAIVDTGGASAGAAQQAELTAGGLGALGRGGAPRVGAPSVASGVTAFSAAGGGGGGGGGLLSGTMGVAGNANNNPNNSGDDQDWSRFKPSAAIRFRFPHGVLMLPASLDASPGGTSGAAGGITHPNLSTSGSSTFWVCLDARPFSKHTMVVGMDNERRVMLWNTAAADVTGLPHSRVIGSLAKEVVTAPGDTFFRLPRLVGDTANITVKHVVSDEGQLMPSLVGDVRDLLGDVVGHCFVSPSTKEDNTSMRTFLHEYLQYEIWDGLTYIEAISKQLNGIIAKLDDQSRRLTALFSAGGTPSVDEFVKAVAGDEIRRASSSYELGGAGGGRRSFLSSREASRVDSRSGRPSTTMSSPDAGQRASVASTKSSEDSGDSRTPSGALGSALNALASDDLRMLHKSMTREVAKLRMTVRQLKWDALSVTARNMATQWEWTNGERLLGAAARYHFSKASVGVDSNVPKSFRLPAGAAKLIREVLNLAPNNCTAALQFVRRSARISRLSVTVNLMMESMPTASESLRGGANRSSVTLESLRKSFVSGSRFNYDQLMQTLQGAAAECCATIHVFSNDTAVAIHFPCVRDEVADSPHALEPKAGGQKAIDGATSGEQATTACDCNVAICLEQAVDQHNLGMMLLGIGGVSLSVCRDVAELKQRIGTADVVLVANVFRKEVVIEEDEIEAIVIPVVDEDAPFERDVSHIRLPLRRDEVFAMVVEASKYVLEAKQAAAARAERELVLQTRHDATWTRGALLGRGTFGVCYAAVNDVTGGRMAVKTFSFAPKNRGDGADLDAEREKFMTGLINEVRILTKLDHPFIVHYFHTEREETGVNLFMELCEGSIHDVIQRSRSLDTSTPYYTMMPYIVNQTLKAVEYLHSLEIVHRDLKPQNILFKGDRIKLTDFGTAQQVSKDQALHDTQGTLRFMAPEVYQAEAYNWSCDVWSIGCIVCELLGVRVSFMQPGGHNMLLELQQSDVNIDAACGQNVSPEAKEFIALCLQVNKEHRPPVSTLLLHPFVQTPSPDPPHQYYQLAGTKPLQMAGVDGATSGDTQLAGGGVVAGAGDDRYEYLPPADVGGVAAVAEFDGDGFSLDSNA